MDDEVRNELIRGRARRGSAGREVLMLNMTRDEHFPIDGAVEMLELIPGTETHGRVDGNPRRHPAGSDTARSRLLPADPHALSRGTGQAAQRVERFTLQASPSGTRTGEPETATTTAKIHSQCGEAETTENSATSRTTARAHVSSQVVASAYPAARANSCRDASRLECLTLAVRSGRADHRRADRVRARRIAGVARRGRAREARRCARAGDGGGADQLGRRLGAPPARVGRARRGDAASGAVSSASRSSPSTGSPSCSRAAELAAARPPAGVDSGRRVGGAPRARADAGPVRAGRASIPPPKRRSSPRTASSPTSTRRSSTLLAAQRAARTREVVRLHRSTQVAAAARSGTTSTISCGSPPTSSASGTPLVRGARHDHLLPPATLEHTGGPPAARAGRARPSSRSSPGSPARRRPTRRSWRACGGSASRPARRSPRASRRSWAPRCGTPPIPTTKCARSCAASSTRCARACRSSAWRCCTRPTSPYARLLHEHFDLAGIAHNGATTRSMSDSVLGRGLLRLLALGRHRVRPRRRVRPVRVGAGARRSRPPGPGGRGGNGSRATRASCAGSTNGAAGSARTRRRSPTDERGACATRAQVEALGGVRRRLSPPTSIPSTLPRTWSGLAQFAHRLVRRYLGAEARRACVAAVRAGRGAAGREPCSTGSARSTRSIPAPTIDVFRRTFELELDAARDRVGRLGDGVLVGSGRRWRSASSSIGCGSAGSPRACSRRCPRDDPLLVRPRPGRARRRAPAAFRPHRRRRARVARGARVHRRARACAPIPAAICGAAPSTCRRGSSRPTIAARRRGAVRSRRTRTAATHVDVSRQPARARGAGRARARAVGRAEPAVARARAQRGPGRLGVHPLRRQPRAPRRPAARDQPGRPGAR